MRVILCVLLTHALSAADPWMVWNCTGTDWKQEPIRVPAVLDSAAALAVDGKILPQQWVEADGRKLRWIALDAAPDARLEIVPHAGPAPTDALVKVHETADTWDLDNGLVAVRVPRGHAVRPPVLALRGVDGAWFGAAAWRGAAPQAMQASLIGSGHVFAAVRLVYTYAAGIATIDVAVEPGRRHATISESFTDCGIDVGWEVDLTAGWSQSPSSCRAELYSGQFVEAARQELAERGSASAVFPPTRLAPGQTRMGEVLLQLLPRWSQAYDDGWLFTVGTGARCVGAMPARAGRWLWPHAHRIAAASPAEGRAVLRLPLGSEEGVGGARYWFLLVGSEADWAGRAAKDYAWQHAFLPLDKLVHEFITEWSGAPAGKPPRFSGFDIWDQGAINPTGGMRNLGAGAIKDAAKPGGFAQLTLGQYLLHPDTYGDYRLGWSSENPNFFTDLIRYAIPQFCRVKSHPRFKDLRDLAEATLRLDMEHSVTLPGGAGQECPGYLEHALMRWQELAPLCSAHLGFDPRTWDRYRAAASFLAKVGPPAGAQRQFHPAGDTHNGKPDPVRFAAEHGVAVDLPALGSEELSGFGAVLRNRPGSGRETLVTVKAGPNRGHFHGDQLSVHACFDAWPVAVDHHASYSVRPGQEHMHNRLALRGGGFDDANMDGSERLLAFATAAAADAVVAEVRSRRLRRVRPLPPEIWDQGRWDTVSFTEEMIYRRSVVLLKDAGGSGRDALVVRDQYQGPELDAIACWHLLGTTLEQAGRWFHTPRASLFVAAPAQYSIERRDWAHEVGGREETVGLRLVQRGASAEYITVLLPRPARTGTLVRLALSQAIPDVPAKGKPAEPLPLLDAQALLWLGGDGKPSMAQISAPGWGLCQATAAMVGKDWAVSGELPATKRNAAVPFRYAVVVNEGADGTYTGEASGRPLQGVARVQRQDDAALSSATYDDTWQPPEVVTIPGGVRIGADEVVFAGGIPDGQAAWVTVRRAGQDALAITVLDHERSQGDIGLFVPDAGYPFGAVPRWLIAQRGSRIAAPPAWVAAAP